MSQNSDYVPFSRVAGVGGASSLARQPARDEAQHYADAASRPRPEMRPAPQGYGEPQDGYDAQASIAAASAAQGRPVATEADDVVVLSKAYTAYGEPVTRIRLRRPVGKDIKAHGNPFSVKVGADRRIEKIDIDYGRIMGYVVACAEPPLTPSVVEQFEFEDLENCAGVLVSFFLKVG